MARNKGTLPNIDNSDLGNYPNGRIKNNTGGGDGTPVNEFVYGDVHETFAKLLRLYGIAYNGLPDNETNGYQIVDAIRALASKNDYILPLSSSGGVLNVPVKLGKLNDDESILLKAANDKAAETTIKGTVDNITKAVTFIGAFKQNEYVRLINTSTGVVLVRQIDAFNVEAALNTLGYLKAADQTTEDAGAVTNAATTPLTNKTTFTKRVIGADSGSYLAKPTGDPQVRNGLLSSADKKKIDDLSDISSSIKISSATAVSVTSAPNGHNADNFNFCYLDIFPPAGYTMSDLKGFMASQSEIKFSGNVNDDDDLWCKWQTDGSKIRVICGSSEHRTVPKVNWLAIWIK